MNTFECMHEISFSKGMCISQPDGGGGGGNSISGSSFMLIVFHCRDSYLNTKHRQGVRSIAPAAFQAVKFELESWCAQHTELWSITPVLVTKQPQVTLLRSCVQLPGSSMQRNMCPWNTQEGFFPKQKVPAMFVCVNKPLFMSPWTYSRVVPGPGPVRWVWTLRLRLRSLQTKAFTSLDGSPI